MSFNLKAFNDAGLVPDYVPQGFETEASINVEFPDSVKVNGGNLIGKLESKKTPKVTFNVSDQSSNYTVLCIDPDAPTRSFAFLGPIRHWAVINIPGSSGEVSAGEELTPYVGPGPPPFTGEHRYVFLLYKQTKADADLKNLAGRMRWDYKAYIKENGLELVAGDFFLAKF